jgi:hypothetical protein
MFKMKLVIAIVLCCAFNFYASAQAPNVGNFTPQTGTTGQGSKLGSVPVNIFTGVPVVGVPLYSYQNNAGDLGWNLSLSYFAGGMQVAQSATNVGLGWFLNATGSVSRTVRGVPDDLPTGYINTLALPTDFRSSGDNYYDDITDAQQDIFQFNCNGRSGKFVISKDHIVLAQEISKLKIAYTTDANNAINSFKITTENGLVYDFSTLETSSISNVTDFTSGYANTNYTSAWYLTKLSTVFGLDSIKFNYTIKLDTSNIGYPQTTFVKNSDGSRPYTYTPTAKQTTNAARLSSIVFPNGNTVGFEYGNVTYNVVTSPTNQTYATGEKLLKAIKISDTTFRYGYQLNYKTDYQYRVPYACSGQEPCFYTYSDASEAFLTSVIPYTPKGKNLGYRFGYNQPTSLDSAKVYYQKDYWGFYNKASLSNPPNLFPLTNGYTWGTNRNPNINYAKAGALMEFNLPDGGYISYQYELNDHYPYTKTPNTVAINAATATTQNTITLNQVFNTKHLLSFNVSSTLARIGSAPVGGSRIITCNIKNVAGTITYATTSFSLYDLFYLGIKNWSFNVPNGSYMLQTQLSAGTSVTTGNYPINITWENKQIDNTINAVTAGGLRVKRLMRRAVSDDPINATIEEFKYITADGKSSGFLGDIPKYDYPYKEIVNGTAIDYTAVSSEPINNQDYSQGGNIGYNRVEVISGTSTHNIGKTVYEFTGLADVNSNVSTSSFPYAPQQTNDWGWGLPKKVSVYDSANTLLKRTVTNYAFDTMVYANINNKSLKLGKSATQFAGTTPTAKTYLAQEFYPTAGRVYPTAVYDTIFQRDGTINDSYKTFVYDSNYNVKKMTTGYDKTRGLQLETRLYYPYNYKIFLPKSGVPGRYLSIINTLGIITPVVSSEAWIIGDGNPRLLSNNITDYRTIYSTIKPLTAYAIQTNKPIPVGVIGNFDSSKLIRDTNYIKQQQQFLLYDTSGNLLQSTSPITNQSSSAIMDYNKQYTTAKISNAAYNDVAYTSFESDGSGNWIIPSTMRDGSIALTGKKSYALSSGNITTLNFLNTGITYLVTVWSKTNANTFFINGGYTISPITEHNGWSLYSKEISNASSITISGNGLIDELRLHPKDANMATNTYEPMVGVTSSTDANNNVTYYEYDTLNRVNLIRDRDRNIIKKYQYAKDKPIPVYYPPHWVPCNYCVPDPVGVGASCIEWHTDCTRDSIFVDDNPLSDSFNLKKHIAFGGVNICICPYINNFPPTAKYKTVNGICEIGVRVNTSTVRFKVVSATSVVTWMWYCTYHYLWSDGSVSIDFSETNANPCGLGIAGEP